MDVQEVSKPDSLNSTLVEGTSSKYTALEGTSELKEPNSTALEGTSAS
jgi:hypothetical protein